MSNMFTPRCPKKIYGGCGQPLVNELEISKTSFERGSRYFVESAGRALIGSGRSTYWCCMNPKCRFYSGVEKFWWKYNLKLDLVPVNAISKIFGVFPPNKTKSPNSRK